MLSSNPGPHTNYCLRVHMCGHIPLYVHMKICSPCLLKLLPDFKELFIFVIYILLNKHVVCLLIYGIAYLEVSNGYLFKAVIYTVIKGMLIVQTINVCELEKPCIPLLNF